MSTCDVADAAVLNHDVDDLLLHARGLVLVREVLARRGASRDELDAHTRELERVRHRLVEAIGGNGDRAQTERSADAEPQLVHH